MNKFLRKLLKFIAIAFIVPLMVYGCVLGLGWVIAHLYLIPPYIIISCIGGLWLLVVGFAVFTEEGK